MLLLFVLLTLAVVGLVGYATGRFLMDSNQLRQFPAPSVAAFTPLWGMWYSWRGTQYKAIYCAHQRLGPVVRIAPNHVSFTDPAAYKDIYGHGNSIIKDDFYSHIAGGNPSMAQATDRAVHSAKRKNLARIFSAKEITAMEPRVMKSVKSLCTAVMARAASGSPGPTDGRQAVVGVFDLRPLLNMFAYDAISSMLFTNEYGFVSKGNDVCPSMGDSGDVKTVNAMMSFHSASSFNTIMAQLPLSLYQLGRQLLFFIQGNKSGSDFQGMSRAQVMRRLKDEPAEPDLFSGFPIAPSEKRPNFMPVEEVVAECTTLLDAGNDTTQTTLNNCIYHLARNPDKQLKLYNVLAAAVPKQYVEARVAPSHILQGIPYLRAILDESWRCRPPVARGLPRRTTAGGATIAGYHIPRGVTVSAPIYALHRNENLFRKPSEFIPERWIPDEEFGADVQEAQNLKNFCIPFSMGPRACIGRNLAYMEVSIVVAALVLNFEWELAEPDMELETVERFNWNPRKLMVRATARQI